MFLCSRFTQSCKTNVWFLKTYVTWRLSKTNCVFDIIDSMFNIWICFCLCALVHNALQLPLFFIFFSSYSTGFWMDCLKPFGKRFLINYQENVWPKSDSLLGLTKRSFRKKCCSSCCSRRVLHMISLIHRNQRWQYPKKHKKQTETWKQVSQWTPEDSRVKTEINWVDK